MPEVKTDTILQSLAEKVPLNLLLNNYSYILFHNIIYMKTNK